jgi:putative transport protein
MEIDISEILTKSPTLLTFLVIGLGYLIGNIRIGPMDIGSTTGVLLTGLLLGHLGACPRTSILKYSSWR